MSESVIRPWGVCLQEVRSVQAMWILSAEALLVGDGERGRSSVAVPTSEVTAIRLESVGLAVMATHSGMNQVMMI